MGTPTGTFTDDFASTINSVDTTSLTLSSAGVLGLGGSALTWNGTQIGLGGGTIVGDLSVHKTAAGASAVIGAQSDGTGASYAQVFAIGNPNYGALTANGPSVGGTSYGVANAGSTILSGTNGTFAIGTNTGHQLIFGTNNAARLTISSAGVFTIWDSGNIVLGTTTGTVIGTAANQKLGFFGATAVVQQNTTGTAVGFTAGAGTGVTDQSTFTGNLGATAYRISDVVRALKTLGLMAQ